MYGRLSWRNESREGFIGDLGVPNMLDGETSKGRNGKIQHYRAVRGGAKIMIGTRGGFLTSIFYEIVVFGFLVG